MSERFKVTKFDDPPGKAYKNYGATSAESDVELKGKLLPDSVDTLFLQNTERVLKEKEEVIITMRGLVVLVFCSVVVFGAPKNPSKIIGGSETTIDRYPHMVSLAYTNDFTTYWHYCGGSILNSRSILSAAHCFPWTQPINWRVRAGSSYFNSGGTLYFLSSVISHPSYNIAANLDYDVAIVQTVQDIAFIENVITAGLYAGPNYIPPDNEVVWTAGWGTTESAFPLEPEQLHHIQTWTVNQNTCRENYLNRYGPTFAVTDSMLCAGWLDVGGRDMCQGDSGGPLNHNGVVVGVASWGRCGEFPDLPGVYARVSSVIDWIQDNA